MWFSSIILTPIALFLMYAAANDAPVMQKDTWKKFFKTITFRNKQLISFLKVNKNCKFSAD
ncbi:MAG: hypothetical protein R2779_08235 [Crocinitomicaceae bacterium]